MSLLWQLLLTLLYCSICDLSQFVFADDIDIDNININNIDEVCARLIIKYQDQNDYGNNNIHILEKESDTKLYNNSIWSKEYNTTLIMVSYDGWTNSWEIILPLIPTSNLPNIYRVESNQIVPPSTIYINKWTANEMNITFKCRKPIYPTPSPSPAPIELIYPGMFLSHCT